MANKLPIITISREYYAGGTTIAKGLSEKLGIAWHEQDVIKLASEISGYTEEEINREGEEISKISIIIDDMLNGLALYKSSYDEIYEAQKDAVIELASEGPCIIVGRCAGFVLKNAGFDTFDIFLHASKEIRKERYIKEFGKSEADALKIIDKRDHLRRTYFNKYTGKEYEDLHNYDLCLDTGTIDYKKCIDIAADIIGNMYQ